MDAKEVLKEEIDRVTRQIKDQMKTLRGRLDDIESHIGNGRILNDLGELQTIPMMLEAKIGGLSHLMLALEKLEKSS